MSFERITLKKIYYYVVCATTLFVLMWGTVDIVSAVFSSTIFRAPSVSLDAPGGPQGGGSDAKNADPMFEEYYQGRMIFDRVGDSLARILIAGGIFLYASSKIKEIESKEI